MKPAKTFNKPIHELGIMKGTVAHFLANHLMRSLFLSKLGEIKIFAQPNFVIISFIDSRKQPHGALVGRLDLETDHVLRAIFHLQLKLLGLKVPIRSCYDRRIEFQSSVDNLHRTGRAIARAEKP